MSTQVITDTQRRDAQRLTQQGGRLEFQILRDNEVLEFSDETASLLMTVLGAAANGSALRLERLPEELTTVQAAKLLEVSRPTIVKWADDGLLSVRMAGTHRRIKLESVLQLQRDQRAARSSAFDDMRKLEDELAIED